MFEMTFYKCFFGLILISFKNNCVSVYLIDAIPVIELVDGNRIPQLGMGTFQMNNSTVLEQTIKDAIEIGYRHIDTAYVYQNEAIIGKVLSELFAKNIIQRKDIFITTKVWGTFHKRNSVLNAAKLSVNNLRVDHVDLLLVHWPMAFKQGTGFLRPNYTLFPDIDSDVNVVETWKGMEDVLKSGLTKSIGLSNFNSKQIERILRDTYVKPVVNQIECNPYISQKKLVDFCKKNEIRVTAYSPLGRADDILLNEPILTEIANKYNKTVPQVMLRWLIQRDIIAIPKTTKKYRLRENSDIFDFQLDDQNMKDIFSLNQNKRMFTKAESSGNFEYPFHVDF